MILSFWMHCLCEFEREIERSPILLSFKEELENLYIS